jgi:hypothetical protein
MPSLKALEDDNAKLKKLLAEAEPDKAMLKEIAAKPVLSSADEPSHVWSAPSGARQLATLPRSGFNKDQQQIFGPAEFLWQRRTLTLDSLVLA